MGSIDDNSFVRSLFTEEKRGALGSTSPYNGRSHHPTIPTPSPHSLAHFLNPDLFEGYVLDTIADLKHEQDPDFLEPLDASTSHHAIHAEPILHKSDLGLYSPVFHRDAHHSSSPMSQSRVSSTNPGFELRGAQPTSSSFDNYLDDLNYRASSSSNYEAAPPSMMMHVTTQQQPVPVYPMLQPYNLPKPLPSTPSILPIPRSISEPLGAHGRHKLLTGIGLGRDYHNNTSLSMMMPKLPVQRSTTLPMTSREMMLTSSSTSASAASSLFKTKGKRCAEEGCMRRAQSNNRCKAHGGGARCQFQNCPKSSQGGGFCRAHGGGKKCIFEGCTKGQQRKGFCYAHGGIRKCKHASCDKKDRGNGYCIAHGGGKRCIVLNCVNAVRKGHLCRVHMQDEM